MQVQGKPAKLTGRAFDVLAALIERRSRLVGKQELLDLVWTGVVVEENNVEVQVFALRKVLGRDAIVNVHRHGYRLALPPEEVSSPAAQRPATASSERPLRRFVRWMLGGTLGATGG